MKSILLTKAHDITAFASTRSGPGVILEVYGPLEAITFEVKIDCDLANLKAQGVLMPMRLS